MLIDVFVSLGVDGGEGVLAMKSGSTWICELVAVVVVILGLLEEMVDIMVVVTVPKEGVSWLHCMDTCPLFGTLNSKKEFVSD